MQPAIGLAKTAMRGMSRLPSLQVHPLSHYSEPREKAPDGLPFQVDSRMVVSIALPMTLAYMTTPLVGLTDTAVIGRLGDAALLGGLAIGAILFDLVYATFNFLRSATTGLTAQARGRKDPLEEHAIFWRSFFLALLIGAMIVALGPLILAGGLRFMDAGPDVAEATSVYVTVRLISAPAALANYAILGFILGRGEASTALVLQVVINVTNIALSVVFGLKLGWGVEGVAWGTVIGETLGVVLGLALVLMRAPQGSFPDRGRLFRREALHRLLSLNGDIMIRSLALLSASAFFTRAGVQFGSLTLAANAVLINFFFVAGYYLDGLATAAEQIGGRAIGANHRPAFDRAIRLTVFWGFVLSGLGAAVFYLAGPAIIDMITTAPQVRAEARQYLVWAALTALSGVLAFQMDGVYIGATWSRDMRNMMLLSLAVFLALVLTVVPAAGNDGLWIAFNLFLGLRGISLLVLLPRRAQETFTR